MLIQRDQLTQHRRRQPGGQDRGRRLIAGHHLVRHHTRRSVFGGDLLGGLAERQHLGLGEEVAHQQVVHAARAIGGRQVVGGLGEPDEIGRHQPGALVQQLIEGVLAVGARLTPEDLTRPGAHRGAVGAYRLAVGLHGQLLQIRREAGQVVRIGQHRPGFRAEEVRVPQPDQTEQHRRIGLQWRGGEMVIDEVEAGQEVGECAAADHRHQRQPDRRIHRVAAAHPVPEAEHVRAVDTERLDEGLVRRHRDEVLGHRILTESLGEPAPGRGRVRQRLQRGERLGRDDEQRRRRIQSVELGHQIRRVDVGDEPRGDTGVGVVPQRLISHRRAQVRAADADVDHGFDPLTGGSGPGARAQPVGEIAHRVEHRVHVGDHVLAIHGQSGVAGKAQRGVQHGAILGGVDVLTGQHGVAARFEAGRAGEVGQQAQRLAGHPVLAVVDIQVSDGQRQIAAPGRVLGEQLPQGGAGELVEMAAQRRPRRAGGDVHTHSPDPMRRPTSMG